MKVELNFEQMLSGGHPNSLGNTVKVVEIVLSDRSLLEQLYRCYFSEDKVVRLRTSNALKRICKVHPQWLEPYLEKFLTDVAPIKQASVQWTLAQLFEELDRYLTPQQLERAKLLLQNNLVNYTDWIVLNTTMETLSKWSRQDRKLKLWLQPHLARLSEDKRKSVAGRAKKMMRLLSRLD